MESDSLVPTKLSGPLVPVIPAMQASYYRGFFICVASIDCAVGQDGDQAEMRPCSASIGRRQAGRAFHWRCGAAEEAILACAGRSPVHASVACWRSGPGFDHADRATSGPHRTSIGPRMPVNMARGSAASAHWKAAERAWRPGRAPVSIGRSRRAVSERRSMASGVASVRRKVRHVVGKCVKLETNGVGGKAHA